MTEFLREDLSDTFGVIGVSFYIGAYALLQLGVLRGAGLVYPVLNLFAASLILLSLLHYFNLYAATIQVAWIIISLVGIVRLSLTTGRRRFSDEELAFINAKLPFLSVPQTRRLMRWGRWRDAPTGDVLAHDGSPVTNLSYLASGAASVVRQGRQIGTASSGALVGESTCLDNSPASATVTLTAPSRLLQFDVREIRQLAQDQEIRSGLQHCFIIEMRSKIGLSSGLHPKQLRATAASQIGSPRKAQKAKRLRRRRKGTHIRRKRISVRK